MPHPIRRIHAFLSGFIVCFFFISIHVCCADGKPVSPNICASFYPLAYFAERIAGNSIQAFCPVPEGKDPGTWFPDRETLSRIQAADLILLNGANYEQWVKKASLPLSRVVETTKGFEKALIRFNEAVTHSHGPAGLHSHEGIDGHTWLDPLNAVLQAESLEKALIKHFPEKASKFSRGFLDLKEDLLKLDRAFSELSNNLKGGLILCSHPAYNYVSKRYGWEIRNHPLNPENMPEANEFDKIKEENLQRPFQAILWESPPKPEIEEKFKGLGIKSIVFSPCELLTKEESLNGVDYMKVMNANLENLRKTTSEK